MVLSMRLGAKRYVYHSPFLEVVVGAEEIVVRSNHRDVVTKMTLFSSH